MKDHEKYAEELINKVQDQIVDEHPVECGTYCLGGTPDWHSIRINTAILILEKQIEVWEMFGYTATFYDHPITGKMTLTEDDDLGGFYRKSIAYLKSKL